MLNLRRKANLMKIENLRSYTTGLINIDFIVSTSSSSDESLLGKSDDIRIKKTLNNYYKVEGHKTIHFLVQTHVVHFRSTLL